jgi:hypothetical protein
MEKRPWANLGWIGALENKKEGKRGIGPAKEKRLRRLREKKKSSLFSKPFINFKLI